MNIKIKENKEGQARPQLRSSGGQVVLVVLLVSALVLTMGLSASKNTVTETKIDTDESLLKQAFNTAESGVEYYLATGQREYNDSNGGSASITTTDIGNDSALYSEGVVLSGKPFLFWLVNHNDDGTIGNDTMDGNISQICVDDGFSGALKVDVFSLNGGNYSISRYGYNIKQDNVNGYSFVNSNCVGPITVSGGLLLSITPISGNTSISINGTTNFPSQGEKIVSVGQMEGGVNTKVTVLNRFGEVPPFMLDAISSGNSVLSQ